MLRVLLSTGNIFFSLILGLLACAFVLINYPDTMADILAGATQFKTWLTSRGLSTQYNNWVVLFLGETQLVLMAFTILARLVLSIMVNMGYWLFGDTRSAERV